MGICGSQRLGKLRHKECHTLWVHAQLRLKDFELRKIRGEVNPADLFIEFLESRVKIDQLLALFACELRDGRPAAAPLLHREGLGQFETQHPDEDALKTIDEAEIHNPEVLPHHYPQEDIDVLFPNIDPPPQEDFGDRDIAGRDPALVGRPSTSRTSGCIGHTH